MLSNEILCDNNFESFLNIKKGEYLHKILSLIFELEKNNYKKNIKEIIRGVQTKELNYFSESQTAKYILNTVEKAPEFFFTENNYDIFNEFEFISKDGKRMIADRILKKKNNAELIIVDYKFLKEEEFHIKQINEYSESLKEIFKIKNIRKYIYYIKDSILKAV
jgi:hypothetical protein